MSEPRLMWSDGRIVPRAGDLAMMVGTIALEGGGTLLSGQNVLVVSAEQIPAVVGIKWRDSDGTHVMGVDVSKLEVVP